MIAYLKNPQDNHFGDIDLTENDERMRVFCQANFNMRERAFVVLHFTVASLFHGNALNILCRSVSKSK